MAKPVAGYIHPGKVYNHLEYSKVYLSILSRNFYINIDRQAQQTCF